MRPLHVCVYLYVYMYVNCRNDCINVWLCLIIYIQLEALKKSYILCKKLNNITILVYANVVCIYMVQLKFIKN